jgi:hypothetical protein
MAFFRVLVAVVILVILSGSAQAFSVQVDWTAAVSPDNGGTPSLGSGLLSGTLGTFDVNSAGDVFDLPTDGSLSITASGFSGGFPNQSYPLTRGTTFPLQLEFLTVGPFAADFSAKFVDVFAGILSPFDGAPCLVGGTPGGCDVGLFDEGPNDFASARWNTLGELPLESSGAVNFTFTLVPEPSTASLLALGLVGITAVGRKRAH